MKNNNTPHRVPSNGRHALMLLSVAMLIFLSTALCLAAGGDPRRYQANGNLTAREGTSTVTIDENGYRVDPSVLVVTLADRPTSLEKLRLPAYVKFDYVYMQIAPKTMSPVIVYIKEAKKPAGSNKRSTR